ncbi:MAG TPA: pyrroloquinoline quinone biosynthesis peptide chaperone PqqD [Gemmatimonadales bacterium]|nr:pyrroloquinoline quinone biosynthesis peptide chaperone PqqD [Gemmatimonadales bacterium]
MAGNHPMTPDSRPQLWRLARIDFDRVRQRPVLLYPEGAMFINETGKAILELCNGARTAAEIARELGERYKSEVLSDVIEYLDGMEHRNLVVDRAGVAS